MSDPFDALKGNERTKRFFRGEIDAGSLSHAYILEGEEGTGKHTLALAVAQALAGDTPEGRKIAEGLSPDVFTVGLRGDKKQLTVDAIRAVKESASLKPNDLSFRFYIIENAECLNVQAQNAALKILEEPPEGTYFFLLCKSAPMLLPTVRSRAPVIRMQRFSYEELCDLLQKDPEAAAVRRNDLCFFEGCVRSCGGSYGRALALIRGEAPKERDGGIAELFSKLKNEAELLTFIRDIPGKRQEFDQFLSLLQSALRDVLLARCGGREETLLFFSSFSEAESAGQGLAREKLIVMYDRVTALREDLARNVNMQNARLTLATGLYNAAVS